MKNKDLSKAEMKIANSQYHIFQHRSMTREEALFFAFTPFQGWLTQLSFIPVEGSEYNMVFTNSECVCPRRRNDTFRSRAKQI